MTANVLLDVFVPPRDLVGHSVALVAMTADDDFLDAAVQQFCGFRSRQRAEFGQVLAYLMLDGHASPSRKSVFPPGSIPALHEFQPRPVPPESLLHAKLVLLAFSRSRTAAPIYLRLAVLTANLTYASAIRQLELVWTVDVPLDGTARAVDRADVAAGAHFVRRLLRTRFYRDEEGLPAKQRKLTGRLDVLLETAEQLKPERQQPRFIHSLDESVYDQIKRRFRNSIGKKRKNLLLCGSGFYEEPSRGSAKPAVLRKLEDLGVFTANFSRVALVDAGEAGAVADWVRSGNTDAWKVIPPFDADRYDRSLHAKFVYVGYLKASCASNGWLYLGSGNLSRRGLLTTGAMKKGNVECGVVIPVNESFTPEHLQKRLFWMQGSAPIDATKVSVGRVSDKPETTDLLEAPPILSAVIEPSPARQLRLSWRDDALQDVRVSVRWTGSDWVPATRNPISLPERENPAELRVRDEIAKREWSVPVVDPAGHVCWQAPQFPTYDDALEALLDFPIRPAEATDDEEDGDGESGSGTGGSGRRTDRRDGKDEKSYALYAAARLIERVSDLQMTLPEEMLDDWIEHLDRMFRASFPETLVKTWRDSGIDILSHLRKPEFRPAKFNQVQLRRYFKMLDAVAQAWGPR